MVFTDAGSVLTYMPSIGPFASLSGSVVNPGTTVSGAFGGEVLGLEFNVNFSDAVFLPGTSGLRLGDLVLANFSGSQSSFNGRHRPTSSLQTRTLCSAAAPLYSRLPTWARRRQT
jgi:hypothetical protein